MAIKTSGLGKSGLDSVFGGKKEIVQAFAKGEATGDIAINDLEDYFIVSKINLETEENMVSTEIEGISVKVSKSDGEKCERCWKYDELGTDPKHLDVCPRCAKVLNS